MQDYVIVTDSSCDVSPEVLQRWGVESLLLSYTFDGDSQEYPEGTLSSHSFYEKMRSGAVVRTSAASTGAFRSHFETILRQNKDVLYISISSTFSCTHQSACIAAQMLQEEFPQRRVVCVDSRCASAGHALLVYLASRRKAAGADLDTVAAFVEKLRPAVCQWLTVEDLMYLKRGGRLGAKEMVAGKLLGVKPLLHINDDTQFETAGTVRGRKKALRALADKFLETHKEGEGEDFFIFHADCLPDAHTIAQEVREKRPSVNVLFSNISACIGAHFGPGAICCAFVGTRR